MVCLEHDVLLKHRRLDLVVFNKNVLADGFDCVKLFDSVFIQLTEVHTAKGAATQLAEDVEIFQLYVLVHCLTTLHYN